MLRRKCKECGKLMYFQHVSQVNTFCSKACYHEQRRKQLTIVDDGPPMPPLKAENITDEGFVALVKAIVKRASRDVTNHKPGTQVRIQAEKFFESDYFAALTGLDGQAILRDLREQGKKKGPDVRGRKSHVIGVPRPVQCIETGVVYGSIKEAAMAYNVNPSSISGVLTKKQNRAAKMHWRYVEG